jgi:NAD/NADP transhydrogenase alpha subunit
VASLLKAGFKTVVVESGAGAAASFSDADYVAAGATIGSTAEAFKQDVVLKVRPPDEKNEAGLFKESSRLISFLYPAQNKQIVDALQKKKLTVLGRFLAPAVVFAPPYCLCMHVCRDSRAPCIHCLQ